MVSEEFILCTQDFNDITSDVEVTEKNFSWKSYREIYKKHSAYYGIKSAYYKNKKGWDRYVSMN